MTKGARNNLLILAVIGLLLGIFYSLGGIYGTVALLTGKSPIRLIPPTSTNLARARANAGHIVKAIELYRLDKQEYPRSLHELVKADFLNEVPPSGVGDDEYKYRLDPQKGFVLEYFIGPNYQKDWYEGASAEWYSDQ